MGILASLISAIFLGLYFMLKYAAYFDALKKRPTLNQVWTYHFENNEERKRNARKFRSISIVFALIAVVALVFDGRPFEIFENKHDVMAMIKMMLIVSFGVNFIGRYVIYKESLNSSKETSMPLIEIISVYIKTGWLVKGGDFVASIINGSSVLIVILFGCLFAAF